MSIEDCVSVEFWRAGYSEALKLEVISLYAGGAREVRYGDAMGRGVVDNLITLRFGKAGGSSENGLGFRRR